MTNNTVALNVTTNAVACECGEAECFFCEPFAGMTEEEAWDLYYSCPKCHALASEDHDEYCRYGQPRGCGHDDAYWQVDSYLSDVKNDSRLRLICDDCNREGAQDI